jgi:hypothetical protein
MFPEIARVDMGNSDRAAEQVVLGRELPSRLHLNTILRAGPIREPEARAQGEDNGD